MLAELIFGFLRAFLPWFFSGSTTTEVRRTAGLNGLDRDTLSGKSEMKDFLPKLCLLFIACFGMAASTGCAFGGAKETVNVIMVEPGDTLEIAEERPIQCLVKFKDKDGKEQTKVVKRKMAGTVAAPKSVYQMMQKFWVEGHPPAESPK